MLAAVSLLAAACGQGGGTSGSGTAASSTSAAASATGSASAPPTAGSGTSAQLAVVLGRALEEEQHALATYQNVVRSLGDVPPFNQVVASEAQHLAALEGVARAHGVPLPTATPTGAPAPATLVQACQMGVAAEKADIALYDELLPQVSAHPDVTLVFRNLRAASQNSHLPAFERCA